MIKKGRGGQDLSADEADMKRGNTMGDNTQDDGNNMGSVDEITANGAQEDN
jgi:hypothetical protein